LITPGVFHFVPLAPPDHHQQFERLYEKRRFYFPIHFLDLRSIDYWQWWLKLIFVLDTEEAIILEMKSGWF